MAKDDEAKSNEALVWLRGKVEVHEEMDEMKAEQVPKGLSLHLARDHFSLFMQESMKTIPKATLLEMVRSSALRQPLIIALMMMLAQQLSGINAVC